MVKQFVHDTFEKLAEEGRELTAGTVKKAAQELFHLEKNSKLQNSKSPEDLLKKEGSDLPKNYTELDKKSLGETYQKQDDLEIEALKKRLFQNVKSEGENAHYEAVQKEQERLRAQEQPSDKNEKNNSDVLMPKGKAHRNMFGGRKKAVANLENKPAQAK